uniref:NADH-ubiquinone oxidoreductase chain 6 n=1 Tax=Ceratopus sp. CG351 TaxID=2480753 RepID=A0A3G2JZG1_9CUCU|nr:NADH dehydrogenase subunit 6 [Ceratopus sp. CG351]
MLMYLFILNFLFSFIFVFLNHPLSLGFILLIQTIVISMMSGFFYFNFWFSYILFLIMIGGMLVMFIYMTSIASNEKFKLSKYIPMILLCTLMMMFMLLLLLDNFYPSIFFHFIDIFSQNKNILNFNLNKFFNTPYMQIMVILMIYLLITLIAVVKIVGPSFGALRQK